MGARFLAVVMPETFWGALFFASIKAAFASKGLFASGAMRSPREEVCSLLKGKEVLGLTVFAKRGLALGDFRFEAPLEADFADFFLGEAVFRPLILTRLEVLDFEAFLFPADFFALEAFAPAAFFFMVILISSWPRTIPRFSLSETKQETYPK
jgi:hypothetical protein